MCLHSCIVIEITRCILAQNKMFIMTSSKKSILEDRTRVHNELLLQDWTKEGIAKQHFSTLDYCNRFSNYQDNNELSLKKKIVEKSCLVINHSCDFNVKPSITKVKYKRQMYMLWDEVSSRYKVNKIIKT